MFSLPEGAVSFNTFFPSQGDYVATMAYRNALGKEVLHRLGVFRVSGKLELSTFVGAKVYAEAGATLQYKPVENPAGATALLGTPSVGVGRGGNIGVKCDAFAGAQVGGALSGAFEWIEPDKQGLGQAVFGQANASNSPAKLAEIKVEGNVAVGAGLNGEFGIDIADNQLALNCKGSIVLGPGVGGGFGTVVDLEQVGKVIKLFCNALAEVDYRRMLGVTKEAFTYMTSSLYRVATSPAKEAVDAFDESFEVIEQWWSDRIASKTEAKDLAEYIIKNEGKKVMTIKKQPIPFNLLPPETLGPMIYVLSEGFFNSFNKLQESFGYFAIGNKELEAVY